MDQNRHITTAASLIPGQVYRVKAAFIDYDGDVHHIGETWRFVGKNFLPYEDGLTLEVEQNGQRQVIRLQWRPEAQAEIIQSFSGYVEAVEPEPVPPVGAIRANRSRPWWSCFAIGAAIIAAIACLGAVGFALYFLNALEYKPGTIDVDMEGISVELDAPISVDAGQDFSLTVRVGNSSDQDVLLDSLMIDSRTMDAVTVQGSDPAYTEVSPSEQDRDFLRYHFNHPIPANGSLEIRLDLNAQKPGTY